ncbi:PREDICTED: alpha-tocopherol transfer protein-like [Nicrophorus vespilloides]|uniref:Alpha-tocopherol transfer protein-like n=1 Tax=Nicrophorus vespilloides TaxID=110193 RepID=A0ABM1M1K6_NICVS|nr:PREDICTED: alpha-tocopherol transfer protein-like [Nicrophorus vespilloides]
MDQLIIGDVEKEYVKCPELQKEDVTKILEWMETQPHLPKMTEMQAVLFLHSNYFDSEKSKRCIENFFTTRSRCPEFFANLNPKEMDFDTMLYSELPKRTPEGYKIVYAKIMDPDPDRYTFPMQIKFFDMVSMLMLNRDGTSEGQVVVHDLDGITFSHVAKMNFVQLRKFFFYLQESMPVRIRGMHFINLGTVVEKIMSLIKPFMRKDLVKILYTHADVEGLLKYIPKECLPNNLGGEAGDVSDILRKTKEDFYENEEFFAAEELQVVDESKRPKDSNILGNSFKNLAID